MSFGNASLPTRKYVYGVREFPSCQTRERNDKDEKLPRCQFDGCGAVREQLYLANKFQNKLVEIELARRGAADAALLAAFPDLAGLLESVKTIEDELERVRTAIKRRNINTRMKVPRRIEIPQALPNGTAISYDDLTDVQLVSLSRTRIAALRTAETAYRDRRREAFRDPAVRAALDVVDNNASVSASAARTEIVAPRIEIVDGTERVVAGLFWATANMVMPRVKRSGPPPRFKRFDGTGTVSVQFQRKPDTSSPKVAVLDSRGEPMIHPRSKKPKMAHQVGSSLRCENVFTPNTLCWFERVPVRSPFPYNDAYVTVHFRVGSNPDGTPIWAHLPTKMHRPLPQDGQVKWAHVSVRRIGTHMKYELMLDVARAEWTEHPAGAERATTGTVAVALGWRRIDGQIRVGEWVGRDGATGTIWVGDEEGGRTAPDRIVAQWSHIAGLQSCRDKLFDESKAVLLAWIRTGPTVSEEFARRTETLAHWNSPRRLARLVGWWRYNRFDSDATIFPRMEGVLVVNPDGRDRYSGGRKQDKHLADWQANMQARLIAFRKGLYRKIAIDLSRRYKSVVVAEIDYHEIAANNEPEDVSEDVNKRFRALGACATLRDCLTCYMDSVEAPAEGITVTCHVCGSRMTDPGRGQWVRCERCNDGRRDRAENAARNLLKRAFAPDLATSSARGS